MPRVYLTPPPLIFLRRNNGTFHYRIIFVPLKMNEILQELHTIPADFTGVVLLTLVSKNKDWCYCPQTLHSIPIRLDSGQACTLSHQGEMEDVHIYTCSLCQGEMDV